MATFRKRNNKWQARVQTKRGPTQARTFNSLVDAKRWALKIETNYDAGIFYIEPQPITLGDAFKRYFHNITPRKKWHKVEEYRIKSWIRHPLNNKQLHLIKTHHVATWRDEMLLAGRKPNTIRLHLAVLSHLYTIAKSEWGYEQITNPVTRLHKPKLPISKDVRVTDEDINLLIKHTNSSFLPNLILLALHTTMRRSELIKLTWDDIDTARNIINVRDTKNNSHRYIPISPSIAKIISNIPKIDHCLFNITNHAVSVAFRRAVIRSKLYGISFHSLRHEGISRYFEKGLSIPEVALISGHKNWSILKRYTHLNPEFIQLKNRMG
jgi:integrase